MATWSMVHILMITEVSLTSAVLTSTLLPSGNVLTRLELIKEYFFAGFKYVEIVLLLFCRHNIRLSLRQLKRILSQQNLRRRQSPYTPAHCVKDIIVKELLFSGSCIGYRSMWQRLKKDFHLKVKRNDVMVLLGQLDPKGVEARRAHRLRRRTYTVPGHIYVWHVDGYDKLKPFGLAIHGAMDGYSRRIMWLEVGPTNNNPKLITNYFLETVKTNSCVPRIIRADCGKENSIIAFLQPLLRSNHQDSLAGIKRFIYGRSTSNQRIERWWGYLRSQGLNWWIKTFKDLRDAGHFDAFDPVQVECIRFCFTDMLQAELDQIARNWNLHNVRPQRNAEILSGKPEMIFHVPELYGNREYRMAADINDVRVCKDLYTVPKEVCSEHFKQLAYLLKTDLEMPSNSISALELYNSLLSLYD